jgi:hypothetical protein
MSRWNSDSAGTFLHGDDPAKRQRIRLPRRMATAQVPKQIVSQYSTPALQCAGLFLSTPDKTPVPVPLDRLKKLGHLFTTWGRAEDERDYVAELGFTAISHLLIEEKEHAAVRTR